MLTVIVFNYWFCSIDNGREQFVRREFLGQSIRLCFHNQIVVKFSEKFHSFQIHARLWIVRHQARQTRQANFTEISEGLDDFSLAISIKFSARVPSKIKLNLVVLDKPD